jgi:hypothetical protein
VLVAVFAFGFQLWALSCILYLLFALGLQLVACCLLLVAVFAFGFQPWALSCILYLLLALGLQAVFAFGFQL